MKRVSFQAFEKELDLLANHIALLEERVTKQEQELRYLRNLVDRYIQKDREKSNPYEPSDREIKPYQWPPQFKRPPRPGFGDGPMWKIKGLCSKFG